MQQYSAFEGAFSQNINQGSSLRSRSSLRSDNFLGYASGHNTIRCRPVERDKKAANKTEDVNDSDNDAVTIIAAAAAAEDDDDE